MGAEKRKMTAGILMCCMLCILSLFVYSRRFVNVEVTPKWIGLMLFFFAFALTIQGILQHADMFPFGKMRLAAIGNFDNPAGFAAALACAFPFCFLFFTDKTRTLRYAAID